MEGVVIPWPLMQLGSRFTGFPGVVLVVFLPLFCPLFAMGFLRARMVAFMSTSALVGAGSGPVPLTRANKTEMKQANTPIVNVRFGFLYRVG